MGHHKTVVISFSSKKGVYWTTPKDQHLWDSMEQLTFRQVPPPYFQVSIFWSPVQRPWPFGHQSRELVRNEQISSQQVRCATPLRTQRTPVCMSQTWNLHFLQRIVWKMPQLQTYECVPLAQEEQIHVQNSFVPPRVNKWQSMQVYSNRVSDDARHENNKARLSSRRFWSHFRKFDRKSWTMRREISAQTIRTTSTNFSLISTLQTPTWNNIKMPNKSIGHQFFCAYKMLL